MALCACGCGGATSPASRTDARKGWVKGQPLRFLRGHQCRKSAVPYVEDERGCWIWQRATADGGYGSTFRNGRLVPAHRAIYEDTHGPIGDGLVLDHLCRTPACVRPDHLEPVSFAENMRRGKNTKLRHDDVRAIRRHLAAGSSCAVEARRFGVNVCTVRDIVAGRSWVGVS